MTPPPGPTSQMFQLLMHATEPTPPKAGDDQVPDEHLLLVAQGRVAELGDEDRERLLRRIINDPLEARLLREMHDLSAQEQKITAPTRGPILLRRWLSMGLAAAACLLITLGIWRLIDPPAPFVISTDGTIGMAQHTGPQATPETDYWGKLDRQQREDRLRRDELRDYALLAATGTSLVLAVGLLVTRRRGEPS